MWKRARQKQVWALGENLKKYAGAAIAISLVAAKNHCCSYLCAMECCMMGVGTIARNA